jgi:hypothetical protein
MKPIITDEWARLQVRRAKRYGVTTKDAYYQNLDAGRDFYVVELRRVWPQRHDAWTHDHARRKIAEYVQALREITFLRAWLPRADLDEDCTFLRWEINRTKYPLLLNGESRVVACLRKGNHGRGFRWEIFTAPRPLNGALYDLREPEHGDVLCFGEAARRKTAIDALRAEIDKRSIGLFKTDRVDIPILEYDGNYWLPDFPHRIGHAIKLRQVYGAGFDIAGMMKRVRARRNA